MVRKDFGLIVRWQEGSSESNDGWNPGQSLLPKCFFTFIRRSLGNSCLPSAPTNHTSYSHSQGLPGLYASHLNLQQLSRQSHFEVVFFLQLDQEVYSGQGFFHIGQFSLAIFCLECSERIAICRQLLYIGVGINEKLFLGRPAWIDLA